MSDRRRAKSGEAIAWLLAHVGHEGDDCLLWPFGRDNRVGRGRVQFRGKLEWAHRAMCTLAHGEPPTPKHQAAHSCGNGHLGCINQRHLKWATNSENQHDRRAHGRREGAIGTRTRLTLEQIAHIRRADQTQVSLMALYGVSLGCIQYWQRTTHEPLPPGTSERTRRRRQFPASQWKAPMSKIEIHNEPCDCRPGQCAEGLERDTMCINRWPEAHTEHCAICGSSTWHAKGKCLRCEGAILKPLNPH